MSAITDSLREELKDAEYSEGYAESFLDSYIATQIKVLREQHGLSQQSLAELIGSKQGVISRIENVNYSKWNISTLKKLARAFRLRLKVSFETYGSLLAEVDTFSRESLQRAPRENDPFLDEHPVAASPRRIRHKRGKRIHTTQRTRPNLLRMPSVRAFEVSGPPTQRVSAAGIGSLNSHISAQATQGLTERLKIA